MKKGGLLLGYTRVSKADDQDNSAQVKALRLAECKWVFDEKASGWPIWKAVYRTLAPPPQHKQNVMPISCGCRETLFSWETFVGRPDRQPTPNEL
jgi:hypothetical protein